MEVVLARHAGACYGVERAIEMAFSAIEGAGGASVATLGPLIHNPQVVRSLEEAGARVVATPAEAGCGTLVIRSHGVAREVLEDALSRGLNVVDATCPHVQRVQREAARLAGEGRVVVIVGEPGHPEVEGILSYAGPRAVVAEGPGDVAGIEAGARVGVVVQTTQSPARLAAVEEALRARGCDVETSNTICAATTQRQRAAVELARGVDAMVVIGGRDSGNTRRLCELCLAECPSTHHIEEAAELEPGWFAGCSRVGVTAGASTPRAQIDAVIEALSRLNM